MFGFNDDYYEINIKLIGGIGAKTFGFDMLTMFKINLSNVFPKNSKYF